MESDTSEFRDISTTVATIMIYGSLGNSISQSVENSVQKRKSFVTFIRCVSFQCFKTNFPKLILPQVMSNFRKYRTETGIAAIMQSGCSKYFFGS